MLGEATEAHEGRTLLLKWTMADRASRRIEEGIPKMDRSVGISFATTEWSEVARALNETLASLNENDPEIGGWAREAAKGVAPGTRALVSTLVEAAGRAVKEASPGTLSDVGIGRAFGPQSVTARTILTDHEGSRSWLIVRALRELGTKADVAIAENDPYSADPKFPPHFGRFLHPLVVAHLNDGDVWIDADVPGPPLPAGRISPELRGRSAIWADGRIEPLPAVAAGAEPDAVTIDLKLDAQGNARGTFAIALRGRDAQELAEILLRIVGAERQRTLRGVVLAWVPFANVDDVVLSSSEGSWQVDVRADISVSGYAQVEGATPAKRTWVLPGVDPMHWVMPRPYVSTLGATFTGQGARENALAISAAVQYQVHRRVELPAGASVMRLPSPLEVKTAHLEARRRIAVKALTIEDDFSLQVPTGTIPASEYAAFVNDTHKTDDAFLASTWVKPAP
jgi:hypothetical protein